MPKYKLKPVKGKKEFSVLFNKGKRFYEADAMAVTAFDFTLPAACAESTAEEAGTREIFYAVSVRKKTAKKSVVRNRIKRLLRESLRQVVKEFEAEGKTVPFSSIMLFWKNAPKHPMLIGLQDVLPGVRKIFQKACIYRTDKELTKKQETETNAKNINPADKRV